MPDELPVPWKVLAVGTWAAAVLGAAAMWAVIAIHDWLRSPYVQPIDQRPTTKEHIP